MKKVFQIKLKNITRLLAVVIVASLATFTGCKSYDSDISQLNTDIAALTKQVTDLNTATTTAVNAQIATLTAQLTADEAKLTALQTSSTAQAAQIAALQSSITTNTASIAALQSFQTSAAAEIATLKTQITAAAKLDDLTALQNTVNSFITSTNTTLTTLGARVTTVETNLTTAQNDIAILKGQVDAQLALINGLQTAVTTNTDDIAELRTDLTTLQASVSTLQTKVNQNTTDIAANTDSIAANTAAIAALQTKFAGVTANFKALANAMNLNFQALSSRLTSLEFVADFNVNGVAAMNFSPLTSQCTAITPSVTVAYHLNPSFITATDIETANMSFVVLPTSNLIYTGLQPAKAVADAPEISAIFNKIENGKLYVDVKVEDIAVLASTLGLYGTNAMMETFNSIALQVPLSQKAVQENAITFDANDGVVVVGSTTYPTDRVITSAYVRLFSQNILASNINLVRTIPSHPAYPKTLTAAEALTVTGIDGATATDPTVVELPYGQTLDLVDQVIAWYNGSAFDVAKYGLNFKFDLLDENGVAITYVRNTVDQETLINITDAAKGTIKANPATTQGTIALSQGRTPIVRVTMYNNQQPDCPVLMSFIKVRFEETPPVTHTFTVAHQIVSCDNAVFTVPEDSMLNQIYSKIGMTKAQFLAAYPGLPVLAGDPTVSPITATTSLVWTLTATDVWTKLNSSDPATFTATVTYTPTLTAIYPTVTITLTRSFTKPAIVDIPASPYLITNYWYNNYTNVKHNIVVPNVGETDNTKAIFANNINQAFEQNSDNSLMLPAGLTNYHYYFHKTQPTLTGSTGNVTLTASTDGLTLLSGAEVVATINPFVANIGDILTLNQTSAVAKDLLNYGKENLIARIGIRTIVCPTMSGPVETNLSTMPVTVNGKPSFDVVFVRPINTMTNTANHYVDGVNYGDQYSYIEISSLVNLIDWRYSDPVSLFSTHDTYYQYYGISDITADVANITTDLNQAAGVKVPLAQYPNLRVAFAADLSAYGVTTVSTYGYLTYHNNENVLGVNFNLYVPVTITYSWGSITSDVIKVPVYKTVGEAGVKAHK